MNIVLYGIPREHALRLAERYGFETCSSFEALNEGNRLLLQPHLATDEEQLAFFEQMARSEQLIDAVIIGRSDAFSTVHYCSSPGKLFTVNRDADEESLDYELDRIVGEIARASGKLANHNFVAKAPKKLVDDERSKLEKFLDMKKKTEDSLKALS